MKRHPSPEMRADIIDTVQKVSRLGHILYVDGLALQIQASFPAENIALEDISEYITRVAIDHQIGVALPRQFAGA